jgi:succinate dehydrogenase/fumarate reductase flavoprotein subunit
MPAAERRDGVDLIVIGGSVGGLTAAITAADRGCQVALVERAKDLGGGAAVTDEAVAAAGSRWQRETGIDDQPERLVEDLMASGVDPGDGELIRALVAQAAPLVEWLADRCGASVRLRRRETAPGTVPAARGCRARRRQPVATLHARRVAAPSHPVAAASKRPAC